MPGYAKDLIREVHGYKDIDCNCETLFKQYWSKKNNNSARASRVLVHFFAVHVVKLHNVTFCGRSGTHVDGVNFLFRFITWMQALPIQLHENSPTLNKMSEVKLKRDKR